MTADYFRAVRETLGLSPGQLADRLGIHRNTVYRIERGDLPIRPSLEKTMQLLQRTPTPTETTNG